MDKTLNDKIDDATMHQDAYSGVDDANACHTSARLKGISSEELDSMLRNIDDNGMVRTDEPEVGFVPKLGHIVGAVVIIILLGVFVFVSIDFDDNDSNKSASYTGLSNVPITEADLFHLYSGSYEGKSILLTVKEVKKDGNKHVMLFDLKCDFVPVAQGCRCMVDLAAKSFSFEDNEEITRKVPLGAGSIQRTAAGKVVLKPASGLYELVQL